MARLLPSYDRDTFAEIEQGSPYDERTKEVATKWLDANRDRIRTVELKLIADSRQR